ncbi:DUF452 family protein [Porphyromonadaceae bacterium W3.11]|nr:DUF452 family protein [Porphyromonadaceae bacterium W3.11]
MITKLISKEGNNNLLIYFTGWGTTPEVVAHLAIPEGWDYLTAYDFRDLNPDDLPKLKAYDKVYLVAWSMGVCAADALASYLPKMTKAVAVNGTALPMHDQYGIPYDIFKGTLDGLSDESRARFNRRMCGGKKLLAVYNSFSQRSTEDLREELTIVYERALQMTDDTPPNLAWTNAIVSEKDLIVPPKNQVAYWTKHHVPTYIKEGVGHYFMMEYSTWQEFLDDAR